MRVALYCRCSTLDQSVDLQLDGLRDYAKARGFAVVEEYVDKGVSGARSRRPALDQLLANAHRRRFDAVLIWRLDRLARSVRHLVNVAADLETLGIDLVVLDQGIDTSTSAGRFLFHTLAAVGELERELMRERTVAGLAAAKRRGKRLGRPRVHVPRTQAEVLIAQGKTVSEVARSLGVARSTLQRALPKTVSSETVITSHQ